MSDVQPRRPSRLGLYLPLGLALVALAAWTGWWFYLSGQIERHLELRVAALTEAGWTVEHAGVSTTGWPFRARIAVKHVTIAAPSGHALAAPELVAEANAYRPDRWMVLATDGLTLTRADKGRVAVRAGAIRASVHGLTQRYPNVALEVADAHFTALPDSEPFPLATAGRIEFYMRPHLTATQTNPDAVDVLFRLIDAEGREGGPVAAVAQQSPLTAQIEAVIQDVSHLRGADAAGVFAAWTRDGGRFTRVRGEIRAARSRAEVSSESLTADADGRLEGEVALSAVRPLPSLIGLARSGGASIDGAAAARAGTAAAGADDDTPVALSLEFRRGRAFLGPFAVGPAPKLF